MNLHKKVAIQLIILLTIYTSVFLIPINVFGAASAQTTTGTLLGLIIDQQNTPIYGVVVRFVNTTNGLARTARSDTAGNYRFDLVPPGIYNINASADGYQPNSIINYVVEVNREKLVKPPPIKLLPISAQITNPVVNVNTADLTQGTQANTADIALRGSSTADFITALPLPGIRNFDILALLTPGVVPPPTTYGANGPGIGTGIGTAGQFSVNGNRARANNFTIDGSDNNDQDVGVRRQGFTSTTPQTIESITEFQLSTLLADAEAGRNTGGQVNVVSKSGTNQFHGGIYDFFTDSSLNARDFFDLIGGPSKGKNSFTRNQFGGFLSGPIIQNKLHFFSAFEHHDINRSQETHFLVPTQADRISAFNFGKINPTGQLLGQDVLSLFPLPNNFGGPYGESTFTQIIPTPSDATVLSTKLDYQFKLFDRDSTLTSRYNFTDDNTRISSVADAINSSIQALARTQNLAFELNTQISSRDYNQIRFSYGRTALSFQEVDGNPFVFQTKSIGKDLTGDGNSDGRTGPIGRLVLSPFSPIGVDPFTFPQGRANNTFQIADTFIMTRGRNTFKIGADIRRVQFNSFLDRNFRSQLTFTPGFVVSDKGALQITRGLDFAGAGIQADFLQALATTPNSSLGLRFTEMNFFAHNSFKLHPRITLELGIRYERNTVPTDASSKLEKELSLRKSDFPVDPKDQGFAQGFFDALEAQGKFLGNRTKIYNGDGNNFAPRVGVAWDVFGDGHTSLRGGYGLFYDPILGNIVSQSRNVFPSFVPINFGAGITAPELLSGNPAFIVFENGSRLIQPGTLNTVGVTQSNLASSLGQLLGVKGFGLGFTLPTKDFRTPYVHQYAISLERALFDRYVVSISYAGTTGRKLIRFGTPNGGSFTPIALIKAGNQAIILPLLGKGRESFRVRPETKLGSTTIFDNSAESQYHSLQASLIRRFASGLGFQIAYTYSHAIDDVSDIFDLTGSYSLAQDEINILKTLRDERGNANFDARHRFTTGWQYDLPLLKQHKYLGGFQLSGILTLQTGQPFTVNTSIDTNLDGNLTDRLNTTNGLVLSGGQKRISLMPGTNKTSLLAIDPLQPLSKQINGIVGRNTFRAAGIASLDLAVTKHFAFTENQSVNIRMEVFNLFNRTHFGIPIRILESPSFGTSVNTSVSARTIQFALKYNF